MSAAPTDSTATWTSSATPDEIVEQLRRSSRIALLTHSKPDGDAVGSTLALARALTAIGKHAVPVYLDPWPQRFDEIVGDTRVIHEHHAWTAEPDLQNIDCLLIADTGSWNQLADARAFIEQHTGHSIVIDHHAHGDPEVAPTRWIDPTAAAAAQMASQICCALLDKQSPAQLPRDVAEPLYLGIATDTGWFRYANLRPETLRLAADFIDAGVCADALYRSTEQCERPERLLLMQRAISSMKLLENGRVAVMTITQKDVAETGAELDEVGGFTDLPQSVATVRAVAVIVELGPDVVKVSLRSKAGRNEIDVNEVAQTLGGGGHKHAAGAKLHLPLKQATQRITEALISATR